MTDLAGDSPQTPPTPFERIRRVDSDGLEFWSARDLMTALEYTSWQYFKPVLIRAQIACENSGHDPDHHFMEAHKLVSLGSDAKREIEDVHLSRYACYLIVQNADPSKEVVALGQTYFAVQTRQRDPMARSRSRLISGAVVPVRFGYDFRSGTGLNWN